MLPLFTSLSIFAHTKYTNFANTEFTFFLNRRADHGNGAVPLVNKYEPPVQDFQVLHAWPNGDFLPP